MFSSADRATIASDAEIVPLNCFGPLDFEAIYGRRAPLEVDLGCGDGLFITAIAAENPARNFLGIERLAGRVRTASRNIELRRLTNARVWRFEISYAVAELLPPNSVAAFHLMFPDPWPKRRHASRRLVTENFLVSLHRALIPNGTLRIATDESEYFRQIMRLVGRLPQFLVITEEISASAVSRFERKFQEDGVRIHRLGLRKVSDVR
jgi:tRNA (guanine-N7-)-methyltransferase